MKKASEKSEVVVASDRLYRSVRKVIQEAHGVVPADFIKNPMLLEFLSLPAEVKPDATKSFANWGRVAWARCGWRKIGNN